MYSFEILFMLSEHYLNYFNVYVVAVIHPNIHIYNAAERT